MKDKILIQYKYISFMIFLLPRMAIVYPFYALSSFVMALDRNNISRGMLVSLGLLVYATSHIVLLSFFYKVSVVNMLLDYAQILPLFLLMTMPFKSWDFDSHLIIILNYAVFVLSIINMTVNYGFPLRLPYLHYLPDAIAAFWGSGGVKITTTCGFMAILCLIRNSNERNYFSWGVAIFNFILPSYNIGIMCGLLGISFLMMRNLSMVMLMRLIFAAIVLLITVVPYVLERLSDLNSIFFQEYGMHPKLYALNLYFELASTDFGVFVFGGGLGNISGTAALWANESLTRISLNTPMQIPGMFESELHIKTIGSALDIANYYPWAISSSLNKPFFTFATLLFEFGLIVGTAIILRFFYSILYGGIDPPYAKAMVLFFVMIFAIDNLHANPLFWCAILIGMRSIIVKSPEYSKVLEKESS